MPISGIEGNIRTTLEKAAARYGEKLAIQFEYDDVSLSYRELNERVNQFANALRSMGVKKGDHVAVMLPNCPEFPLTWLALAKLGAIMIPINFRYQAHDLEYVLNNSDASMLVIHAERISIFREVQTRCPAIKEVLLVAGGEDHLGSSLVELARKAPIELPPTDISLDDLVNIQYTSGTTGFPKGCMLTHEYWLTVGFPAVRKVTEEDVFLSVQPFYYMDPQWQLIMTLMAGCTMVLVKRFSASRYMDLVRKYGVTCSLAEAATLVYKQPESPLDRQHRLRFVLIFGFPPHLHKKFEERFHVIAREGYGMTEIGSGMSMPLEDSHMTGSGSVGKPRPHRQVRIVDQEGNDVPQGAVGELLVRGPALFKGFYKKPKETAEAFSGDWFHTGDLFRRDENGYYYIVGRKKDMVRRHGENISAAEVEAVLKAHPKILDAAVVPVPDEVRGEEVKAYVIPKPGESMETIPPEELIAFCLERIAKFKVPRFVEYMESFPRTPSQRVEKHKLIAEKKDLRAGCYDAEEKRWRD
jgi:crotonobetaine/carnitine-CoA ligase